MNNNWPLKGAFIRVIRMFKYLYMLFNTIKKLHQVIIASLSVHEGIVSPDSQRFIDRQSECVRMEQLQS